MFTRWKRNWIQRQVQRRKEAAKDLIGKIRRHLDQHHTLSVLLSDAPKRLQKRIDWHIWEALKEAAEDARHELPIMVQNVRDNEIEIDAEDTQFLYETALEMADGVRRMRFANLLHPDGIPFSLILEIVSEMESEEHSRFYSTANSDAMYCIAEAIDCADERQTSAVIENLAERGQYDLLKEFCIILAIPIPEGPLRTCFERYLAGDCRRISAIAEMCIALKDWVVGQQLILEWYNHHMYKDAAAQIALAMNVDANAVPT